MPLSRSIGVVMCLIANLPFLAVAGSVSSIELQKRSFLFGREYFVLRSGRVQMVIQADQVDLGPAVTWLLFDARDPAQSAVKDQSLTFDARDGFTSSALEIELGGQRFSALGHRTTTRWQVVDGIPTVQAQWWAGGIRVTELFQSGNDSGRFVRRVHLEGVNLIGNENVFLRLYSPSGNSTSTSSGLVWTSDKVSLEIKCIGAIPSKVDAQNNLVVHGPITVAPTTRVSIVTELHAQLPDETTTADRTSTSTESSTVASKWLLASRITTSDALLQDIYDKARFGLDGMIADNGAMNAGIFEYGAQWVRDSSNTVIGAVHAGHFELARVALHRILDTMVTTSGATMIAGGFEEPDREQFDQMGELMHALKSYRDWTGDESLIEQYRDRLIAMIERPLAPSFRGESGMVHNRREFWERILADGYELAYQTWLVQGLRDAAELAPVLNSEEHAARWHQEADRTLQAMLYHPSLRLEFNGHLIKRRNIDGEVADETTDIVRLRHDAPSATELRHRLRPDSTEALPIALGLIDPHSSLARNTLDELEQLWNTRWTDGGYDRYHTSSEPDQPGPWPFATCFIMRAQHEAGFLERSRRSLEWLNQVQGGRAGAWFEEIPSNRSMAVNCGILPWTSGEVALFVIRHVLGVRFQENTLIIKPSLFPNSPPVDADIRYRSGRLHLMISGAGKIRSAVLNGKIVPPDANGSVRLPTGLSSGTLVLTSGD